MDGNNSLKRLASVTSAEPELFQGGTYYLSKDFVEGYAHEVKSRRTRRPAPPPASTVETTTDVKSDADVNAAVSLDADVDDVSGDAAADNEHESQGDHPFVDGHEDPCTQRWKAANTVDNKRSWDLFNETGVFASACRHGFVLWIMDMIKSGELYVKSTVSSA